MNTKHYLLIHSLWPFSNKGAQEGLELALALATFNQKVDLLFMGDGLWQITNHQKPEIILRKDFIATFKALKAFGVANIYAEKTKQTVERIIDVKLVDPVEIANLMATADIVFNYG